MQTRCFEKIIKRKAVKKSDYHEGCPRQIKREPKYIKEIEIGNDKTMQWWNLMKNKHLHQDE
jgi:hypothetical protein